MAEVGDRVSFLQRLDKEDGTLRGAGTPGRGYTAQAQILPGWHAVVTRVPDEAELADETAGRAQTG